MRYLAFLTVDNRIRRIPQNLINVLVTESLSNIGRAPDQANWNTALIDNMRTWSDTRTGGDEDYAAEHGSDLEDTTGGNATDPELGGWVIDDARGPVTSARNDGAKFVHPGLGDGGKAVPFPEWRMCESDCRSGGWTGF